MKLDVGGFPNIYPHDPIVLKLSNGHFLGGAFQRHPLSYIPDWIIPPHHEIGQYNVYFHWAHYTWTSNLREQNINSPIGYAVPLNLHLQMPGGRQLLVRNFHLVDFDHQYNFRDLGAYIAMPDGSVYASNFE